MDDFRFETLEATVERNRTDRERLMSLVRDTVVSGGPVLLGVWAPTGQRIYLTVMESACGTCDGTGEAVLSNVGVGGGSFKAPCPDCGPAEPQE